MKSNLSISEYELFAVEMKLNNITAIKGKINQTCLFVRLSCYIRNFGSNNRKITSDIDIKIIRSPEHVPFRFLDPLTKKKGSDFHIKFLFFSFNAIYSLSSRIHVLYLPLYLEWNFI